MLSIENEIWSKGYNNIACIDAFGRAAMFEVGSFEFEKWNLNRERFLVRTNFSITGSGKKAKGIFKYFRANELFTKAISENLLDYRFVLKNIARDITSMNRIEINSKYIHSGGMSNKQ